MNTTHTANPLYPVFLKLHRLNMLIVGGGKVGHEKLSFILKSSPQANITLVAPLISDEIHKLLEKAPYPVQLVKRPFEEEDVKNVDLVIAATDIPKVNHAVRNAAKRQGKLVNVADTPDLCDFYLGAIVTRGNLKIAISTNGKSPTLAKRFRQVLEEILPEETNELLDNLRKIRDRLNGSFSEKVKKLNTLTSSLLLEEKNCSTTQNNTL